MESEKETVERYAAADGRERLAMFLTYRDLREEFTTIDMNEMPRREQRPAKGKRGWGFGRLTDFCFGWQRHCRPAR